MKLFGSKVFGQAIKAAGVGAALMVSASIGRLPVLAAHGPGTER